jgi:hypothetical protein
VAVEVGSVVATPTAGSPPASSATATAAIAPSRPAASGFVPQRLRVDALDIDAPLTGTLVNGDGALVPPDDPAQLAWWKAVRPSSGRGSVLVVGHLDVRGYGPGPLARIVHFRPGDRAELTGPDGAHATYLLRGVTTIQKQALPAADLFGAAGPERLVIVTCGGRYDPALHSWDSNVIAVLDPAPAG